MYEKVYSIKGLAQNGFSEIDAPLQERSSNDHVHSSSHNLLKLDWVTYMDFADILVYNEKQAATVAKKTNKRYMRDVINAL